LHLVIGLEFSLSFHLLNTIHNTLNFLLSFIHFEMERKHVHTL